MSGLVGPLFMLRWKGTICPCLEKSEDTGARKALIALSGMEVTWMRSGRDAKSLVSGVLSNWFGSSPSSSNRMNASSGDSKNTVHAVMEWVDGDKGPELQLQPKSESTMENGEITMKQSAGYIKTIQLKEIDHVVLQDSNFITLQTERGKNGKMHDLVTLELCPGNDGSSVKEAFTLLLEWDGRRLAAIPEEDRELDEEVGIKRRAQKAAHFAKREIEMQKTKREREKRKAKLVKETGGLKYTALAMANRVSDE